MPFASLPTEIQEIVLSHVVSGRSARRLLCPARLVCKQFNVLVSRAYIQKFGALSVLRSLEIQQSDTAGWVLQTQANLGGRFRGRILHHARHVAMSMIAWKRSRNESCNEEQYMKATFQVLVAHMGIQRAIVATMELRYLLAGHPDPLASLTSSPTKLWHWLMANGGLVVSAFVGDLPTVRQMLAAGVAVNSFHYRFGFALNAAAYAGQTACVELLLDAGANAMTRTSAMGLPIEVAAARGHIETVRLLVDRGVDLGFSLSDAIEFGHEDIAEMLLTLDRVDVNAGRSESTPPLLLAVEVGCYRVAEQLAGRPDLQPNRVDWKGQTALYKAAEIDLLDLAKTLLGRPDTDVNLANERRLTALHIACVKGNNRVAHALVVQGRVNANLVDRNGCTALTEAILHRNNVCAAMLLLRANTDVTLANCPAKTPIVAAAFVENLDMVRLLLVFPELRQSRTFLTMMSDALSRAAYKNNRNIAYEINRAAPIAVNMPNTLGYNPLHYLVSEGGIAGVSLLMSMCNVEINRFCMGMTPLMEAIKNSNYDIIKFFLSRLNIDINLASSKGTALTWAVKRPVDNYQVAKLLLERPEIDPNLGALGERRWVPWLYTVPEHTIEMEWMYVIVGPPPLALAAFNGSGDMVELLLRHRDINPNRADSFGRTPLWYAVYSRNSIEETVAVLLGHAATNPNLADCFGWTPLLLAVAMEKPGLVETLMDDPKTNPAVANNDGCTPLSLATRMGRPDIVALLERDFDTIQDERSLSFD